jgi:hypothetical protein
VLVTVPAPVPSRVTESVYEAGEDGGAGGGGVGGDGYGYPVGADCVEGAATAVPSAPTRRVMLRSTRHLSPTLTLIP